MAASSTTLSSGTVTGTGNYVGGVAGFNGNSITGGTATGNVTGADYVGGVVGYNGNANANLINSSATGTVIGTGTHVGGVNGANIGSVTGSTYTDAAANAAAAAAANAAALAAAEAALAEQQQAIFESSGQQTAAGRFSGQGSNSTGQGLNNQIGSFTPSNTGTVNGTMDNHIVYSSDSGSYSATIKSITADGVQFDMEGGSQGGPNK